MAKKDPLWKKEKLTIKSVTLKILEALLTGMETTATHNISRYNSYKSINQRFPDWSREKTAKWLYNLKRGGYIEVADNNNHSVSFTNKAKLKLIDELVKKTHKGSSKYFVSFDVPEPLRTARNKFRSTIKRLGFVQIQKSLWVNDREVGDLVELAAREYGIETYIIYIVSDKSDIDEIIDKKLKARKDISL